MMYLNSKNMKLELFICTHYITHILENLKKKQLFYVIILTLERVTSEHTTDLCFLHLRLLSSTFFNYCLQVKVLGS